MAKRVVHINECDLCGATENSPEGTYPDGWAPGSLRVKRGRPIEVLFCAADVQKLTDRVAPATEKPKAKKAKKVKAVPPANAPDLESEPEPATV